MKSNVANLFILGAPKSGTTALSYNLAQHQDIFMPEVKEPRYFDAHIFYDFEEDYPIKSIEEYSELYSSRSAKESLYRLDGSVFNMYSIQSIENILKVSPNAKFIIVLREPVDATVSMFKQRLAYSDSKLREVSDDFMECWNSLEERKVGKAYPKSCRNKFLFRYDLLYSYENYIPEIESMIDNKNLFIGFYDDLKSNPDLFYSNIFEFLGIEKRTIKNEKHNKSNIVKKSFLLEVIETISKKTFHIREKIGLTSGGLLTNIKNFIKDKYTVKSGYKVNIEPIVYDTFSNTNKYLKFLKEEYNNDKDIYSKQ